MTFTFYVFPGLHAGMLPRLLSNSGLPCLCFPGLRATPRLRDILGKQPLLIKASVPQVTLGFKHLKVTLILLFMTLIYLFPGKYRLGWGWPGDYTSAPCCCLFAVLSFQKPSYFTVF